MINVLTKVDIFELLVQFLDSLVNLSINHHARCHEAFSDGFHFADVHTFLGKWHVLEAQKFLVLLFIYLLLNIKVALTNFHRDTSISHFHIFESQVHLIGSLDCIILCLLFWIDFSVFEMLLFWFIHVDNVVQINRSLLLLLNGVNGNFWIF